MLAGSRAEDQGVGFEVEGQGLKFMQSWGLKV